MTPRTGTLFRVPLTLFVFLCPHPACGDSNSGGNTSIPAWAYVIMAICEHTSCYRPKFSPNFSAVWRVGLLGTSILLDRIYERRMKKVAIKNQETITVHLPLNLQVLPPLPVCCSAESLADYQSGLSSISYSIRPDLEAISTPSLARTVNSTSDGVSITMCVFVFCLILHEVNISFSDPF